MQSNYKERVCKKNIQYFHLSFKKRAENGKNIKILTYIG